MGELFTSTNPHLQLESVQILMCTYNQMLPRPPTHTNHANTHLHAVHFDFQDLPSLLVWALLSLISVKTCARVPVRVSINICASTSKISNCKNDNMYARSHWYIQNTQQHMQLHTSRYSSWTFHFFCRCRGSSCYIPKKAKQHFVTIYTTS